MVWHFGDCRDHDELVVQHSDDTVDHVLIY